MARLSWPVCVSVCVCASGCLPVARCRYLTLAAVTAAAKPARVIASTRILSSSRLLRWGQISSNWQGRLWLSTRLCALVLRSQTGQPVHSAFCGRISVTHNYYRQYYCTVGCARIYFHHRHLSSRLQQKTIVLSSIWFVVDYLMIQSERVNVFLELL